MGSGGSKLDPEREALPARLRPFLIRKLEEIRMHKSGRIQKDSHTLSKKMLLSRNTKDDDNSSHMDEDEHKSNSSLEDSTKVAPAPDSNGAKSSTTMVQKSMDTTFSDCQNVKTKTGSNKLCQAVNTETEMPEPESPQVPLAIAFYDERTIHYRKDDGKGEAKEVKLNVSDEHKEAEDGEEDEEKGRLVDCKDESSLCPGSPSFRVYFQESLDDANDDGVTVMHVVEDDDRDEEIPTEEENGEMVESVKSSDEECVSPTDEKSPREQDNIEIVKSETSNEDSEQNKKNKGKRNRFRKAISNRGPGALKHLLNVKACYYPSCAGHHHKTHLLEKGVA